MAENIECVIPIEPDQYQEVYMPLKHQQSEGSNQDQRRAPRTNIQIWAKEKEKENTRFHLVSNLSPNGLLIEKKLPLSVGALIHLEFDIPNLGESLTVQGVVANTYKDSEANVRGTGIKFNKMSKKSKKKLLEYIKSIESGLF